MASPERLLDGRLKLRHLVLATTIADAGSLARAAEQLRITQPVVTRGLQDLESVLGVPLFERSAQGVVPTVYGTAFIEHARGVIAQIRQAGRTLGDLAAADAGTVTVGIHIAAPGLALPPGSGPRHLLFDAKGRHAYLTLEMNAEVVMFDVQDGNLVERQRLPLTERQEAAAKAAGGLHLSADGRFLYVSNRGTANEIVAFSVGKQDGQLTFLQRRPAEGDHPREFALDPSDNFLLVANQKSNQIVVIRRDPRSGKLLETVQTLKQDAPSDLKFIE